MECKNINISNGKVYSEVKPQKEKSHWEWGEHYGSQGEIKFRYCMDKKPIEH